MLSCKRCEKLYGDTFYLCPLCGGELVKAAGSKPAASKNPSISESTKKGDANQQIETLIRKVCEELCKRNYWSKSQVTEILLKKGRELQTPS